MKLQVVVSANADLNWCLAVLFCSNYLNLVSITLLSLMMFTKLPSLFFGSIPTFPSPRPATRNREHMLSSQARVGDEASTFIGTKALMVTCGFPSVYII